MAPRDAGPSLECDSAAPNAGIAISTPAIAAASPPPELDDAAILRRFGLEPDPVIEAYKVDVDRTLLRQNLMRTPEERWAVLSAALRLAEEVRLAGARGRGD